MGVLDDAIQDHLNLKRHRGADPAELERQEREALGPVMSERATAPQTDEEELAYPIGDSESAASDAPDGDEELAADEEPEETYPFSSDEDWSAMSDEPCTAVDEPAESAARASSRPFDFAAPDDGLDEPAPPPDDDLEPPTAALSDEDAIYLGDDEDAVYLEDDELVDYEDPDETYDAAAEAPPLGDDRMKALAESDVGEDDDVLEETPDFLQETPEHDRLWFEQRSPRDFDFND
jgi:hypothetical protein